MKSMASIKGHPLHPMLVILPAGAFVLAFIFDLLYVLGLSSLWWDASLPVMIVGVIGGIIAAIPGIIDLFSIVKSKRVFNIGITHGALNLILLGVFTFNIGIRYGEAAPTPPPEAGFWVPGAFWVTALGFVIVSISGLIGGHMIYKYKLAVHEESTVEQAAQAEAREEERRDRRGPELSEAESPT